MQKKIKHGNPAIKVVIYALCILLTILSIMPFWIMVVNATRSTTEIQQHAVALLPSYTLVLSANVTESTKVYDCL